MTTYKNYIGGKWVMASRSETFESLNPAHLKKSLGNFQESAEQDSDMAVGSAQDAALGWKEKPVHERAAFLLKVAGEIDAAKDKLAVLLTKENGKLLTESIKEIESVSRMARYYAGLASVPSGQTLSSYRKDRLSFTLRRPIGVFGIITPWNFPLAIPARKIFPALLCGNTVVFKPSCQTPLMGTQLTKILEKSGLPDGVFNMITGSGPDCALPLVRNKKVRGISFSGSRQVGEQIVQNAGIKRLGLELGGKNAVLVLKDADLKLAVQGIMEGAFMTSGQRCNATSRVIVHESLHDKLVSKLLSGMKKIRMGDGLKSGTTMGPLINVQACQKLESYIKLGLEDGAKLRLGGRPSTLSGAFFEPTLFTDISPDMRIANEELFGPVICVTSVSSFDEAISVHNSVDYGLSSAVYTKSMESAYRALEMLEAGVTYINSSTIGTETHMPFGGVKVSGNGFREGGIESLEQFSEIKSVYLDY